MIIVMLMAGEGKRFQEKGYTIPKPFIKVKENSILDLTISSIPEIIYMPIFFTIRTEWDIKYQKEILSKYNAKFIFFEKLTRGNLETAYIVSQSIKDDNEPVLFLDSDNKYDGTGLLSMINSLRGEFGIISCFEPIDKSSKWAFVIPNDSNKASKIMEKDPKALSMGGLPMIGTFGFSSLNLFKKIAKYILDKNETVRNEFYMSQSMQLLIEKEIPVYIFKSKNMISLGTPEDLERVL